MPNKEAQARIKINKLLEAADWRLLDDGDGAANVQLEAGVKISQNDIDGFGVDFEGYTATYHQNESAEAVQEVALQAKIIVLF